MIRYLQKLGRLKDWKWKSVLQMLKLKRKRQQKLKQLVKHKRLFWKEPRPLVEAKPLIILQHLAHQLESKRQKP